MELAWRTGYVNSIKSLLPTLLLLVRLHPLPCSGFTFALSVVSYVVGKIVVYEFHLLFEEMGLEFNLFLPSPRPRVSPQNVELTKTSHNCKPVEKSEMGSLWLLCAPGSLEQVQHMQRLGNLLVKEVY